MPRPDGAADAGCEAVADEKVLVHVHVALWVGGCSQQPSRWALLGGTPAPLPPGWRHLAVSWPAQRRRKETLISTVGSNRNRHGIGTETARQKTCLRGTALAHFGVARALSMSSCEGNGGRSCWSPRDAAHTTPQPPLCRAHDVRPAALIFPEEHDRVIVQIPQP